jgi:hypothetical protein
MMFEIGRAIELTGRRDGTCIMSGYGRDHTMRNIQPRVAPEAQV